MKIISGKYRRQGLFSKPGDSTRPIASRMKEYLFERLRFEIPGSKVLDAFAGTGTIGLEALSREATKVVFIEHDRQAFDLLKKNVNKIGAEEDSVCWRTNILKTSFLPKGVEGHYPYDVIFFDPPYPMIPGLKASDELYKSIQRLAKPTVSSPNCLLIFRTERRTEFDFPPIWKLEDELSVSSSTMFFYRKADAEEETKSVEAETTTTEPPLEEN